MAVPSRIRMRRTAAQLHALEKVEREIRAADRHPRRKYLRDFTDAYTRYSEILPQEQLSLALRTPDVLLVGDYHALPTCQRFAAELVEELRATGKPVVLGLEMVFADDQKVVDEWQSGQISEEELRRRIRHDFEWGYEWEPTRELLTRARAAGAQVRGLDSRPRGDLRRISRRDRHAALEIAKIRAENPSATLVVLFGESHLAPQHLPKLVRAALSESRVLTVLQNVDALFWQSSGEPGDAVRAVRVDADTICVFNATPLEKYERYRLCIEGWRQERPGAPPDVAPTYHNLIYALLRFLDVRKETWKARFATELLPEVIQVEDAGALPAILGRPHRAALTAGPATRQAIGHDELSRIRTRLEERSCCYLPAFNVLLVRKFEIEGAAQETARFVCCTAWGDVGLPPAESSGERAFYAACLENALVEYGSRVLYPGREPLREFDLYALYGKDRDEVVRDSRLSYRDYVRLVDFVALHRDFECNARRYRFVPELVREGRDYSDEKFALVTNWLGRLLGADLYDAYLQGAITKRSIRRFFVRQTGKPKATYFRLVQLCRRARRLSHEC